MALSVSVSLAAKLQKCLRLTQTAESMPTKSPEDRKWKKFRNFYDALGAEWKQGGEFAGKIIGNISFQLLGFQFHLISRPILEETYKNC